MLTCSECVDQGSRIKLLLLRFCCTAYERFTQGDVRAKREVAHALGSRLSLTLGKVEIQPHPLLDVIRSLEPVERGSDKQKQGTATLPNPTWWAMRDDIRNILGMGIPLDRLFKLRFAP